MSIAPAAHLSGVSRRTIGRAVKTGELPAERRNDRWLIDRDDLDEWAQSGRVPMSVR